MSEKDEGPDSALDHDLERVLTLGGRIIPGFVRRSIFYSLFAVSPELPARLWTTFEFPATGWALLRIGLATAIFCFGFSALLCWMSGTLWRDSDPNTLRFLEDIWNMALYALVCPVYVALCARILGLAILHWGRRVQTSEDTPGVKKMRRWRLFLAVMLVLVCAILFVTNYLYDAVYGQTASSAEVVRYWYLQPVGEGAILNQAGFFYVILNFLLISITFLAIIAYVALLLDALSIAASLELGMCEDVAKVLDELQVYMVAMLSAKWLAAAYIANIFIWVFSPLGASTSENLHVSVGAIAVIGWLGTMLPRIYLERRLRLFRKACEAAGAPAEQLKLLPAHAMRGGQRVDFLLGLSFLLAYFDVDPIRDPFEILFMR